MSPGCLASRQYGCLIRKVGELTLNVTVQPQLSGKDRVSAFLLSGACAYHRDYGYFEGTRLFEFRDKVIQELRLRGTISQQTSVKCVRGETVLRGNSILVSKPERKIFNHKLWQAAAHSTPLKAYLKRMARPHLHARTIHGKSGGDRLLSTVN